MISSPATRAGCEILLSPHRAVHDWPDSKAEVILKDVASAMGAESRLLIDEMVLPNQGVHWWNGCLDLRMYAMLGEMERNEDQWESLLGRCALRVVETRTYMPVMRNSVLVVEKV